MDGNGVGPEKGCHESFGHKNAITAVRETIEGAAELGLKYLTLYAFSTENWSRPQDEINALMELLVDTITKEVPNMMENNIRLVTIGHLPSLPVGCQKKLEETKELTANNTGLTVALAISYSGRWEIQDAIQSIVKKVVDHELKIEDIAGSNCCESEYKDILILNC